MVQTASGIDCATFTESLVSSENWSLSEIFQVNSKRRRNLLKTDNKIPGIYKTFAVFPDKRSQSATIYSEVQNLLPIRASVLVPGSISFKLFITEVAASCVSK